MQIPAKGKNENSDNSFSGREEEMNRPGSSQMGDDMDQDMASDVDEDEIPDLDEEDLEDNDLSDEEADTVEWDEPPTEGTRKS